MYTGIASKKQVNKKQEIEKNTLLYDDISFRYITHYSLRPFCQL